MTDHQPDLFIRDQKDALDLMTVPIVALSGHKRTKAITYKHGDTVIRVSGDSELGIATIHDYDIIQVVIGHLVEQMDAGADITAEVMIAGYDLLKMMGKKTTGANYERLSLSLDRLLGTVVRTNISSADGRVKAGWNLIESYEWQQRADGKNYRIKITLASWMLRAIKQNRVLGIDHRYYLLNGVEKWLYRLVRKGAGNQVSGWQWTIKELYERSASTAAFKAFSFSVRNIAEANNLPEYSLKLYTAKSGAESLHAVRRSKLSVASAGYELPLRRLKHLSR